jgi:hypothetical protein
LTDETVWNLRLLLRGTITRKGKKVNENFSIKVKFIEEEGYEPPQGSLVNIDNSKFKITKSRWKLSEDPKDRRDGLWVWGLFKEPLYPFLLLQFKTDAIPLAVGKDEEPDFIQPLDLYAQINHKRDSDIGVILEGSELTIRKMETVKADMFGVADVDVFDEISIGTLSIQAASPKLASSV